MRVHTTDQLFGLEAFSRPIRANFQEVLMDPDGILAGNGTVSGAEERVKDSSDVMEASTAERGSMEPAQDDAGVPEAALTERSVACQRTASDETSGPMLAIGALLNRRVLLSLVFFVLVSTVAMSLFTLVMKTRRKAVSYELAHQTRLFNRMSKHRAVYELEYAYLRANSPILGEFSRQGWREITPHDLTYIPVKDTRSVARGGQVW